MWFLEITYFCVVSMKISRNTKEMTIYYDKIVMVLWFSQKHQDFLESKIALFKSMSLFLETVEMKRKAISFSVKLIVIFFAKKFRLILMYSKIFLIWNILIFTWEKKYKVSLLYAIVIFLNIGNSKEILINSYNVT